MNVFFYAKENLISHKILIFHSTYHKKQEGFQFKKFFVHMVTELEKEKFIFLCTS